MTLLKDLICFLLPALRFSRRRRLLLAGAFFLVAPQPRIESSRASRVPGASRAKQRWGMGSAAGHFVCGCSPRHEIACQTKDKLRQQRCMAAC
jgi:hypothetical protein